MTASSKSTTRGILQITAHQQNKNQKTNDTSGSLHFADTEKSFLIVNALWWFWVYVTQPNCIKTKVWEENEDFLKVLKMFHLEANCPLLNPLSSIEFLKVVLSFKTRSRTFEKWLPYSKCISWLRRRLAASQRSLDVCQVKIAAKGKEKKVSGLCLCHLSPLNMRCCLCLKSGNFRP